MYVPFSLSIVFTFTSTPISCSFLDKAKCQFAGHLVLNLSELYPKWYDCLLVMFRKKQNKKNLIIGPSYFLTLLRTLIYTLNNHRKKCPLKLFLINHMNIHKPTLSKFRVLYQLYLHFTAE